MTRDVLIILHSERSTPGRLGRMLEERGYRLDMRRPCLGDELPRSMADHAAAVIFGGPMSANDPDDWIRREIDWIGVPLTEAKPFLGICLGAQMLSKHLGGTVAPHAGGLVEIGYYPLTPTPEGEDLGPWPEQVYHWHREGLSLPGGSTRLASSPFFETQAFRCSANAYGLQFHPEVTRLTMHRWGVTGAHRFDLPNAQDSRAHLDANLLHDAAVKLWLGQFLTHWLNSSPDVPG